MIAGHRWEYKPDYRGYECVGLPFGGVESHQWCVGCGCRIDDKDLWEKQLSRRDDFLNIILDTLAAYKGYPPVEAGTLDEYKLKIKRQTDKGKVK